MGLFDKIFKKNEEQSKAESFFKTLTAYRPAFTSWCGELYESELVRSAIDARARHVSKLKIQITGSAQPGLQAKLVKRPNEWQTWGQFLYRTSTILDMHNTVFIVPVFDDMDEPVGYFPVLPTSCEIVGVNNEPWLRYTFATGERAAVEFSECAMITKFQYKSDFFGEKNTALDSTMSLMDLNNQGIREAIKNSASYRFAATLNNFAKAEDIAKERRRFSKENLQAEGGGLLLFPNTYTNIQQLKDNRFTVDTEQLNLIRTNVYNYFGVNEEILQNKATPDQMDAFYNGAIEPFQIQLSDAMTDAVFTQNEIAFDNRIDFSASRLQYMNTTQKVEMAKQLGDRGAIMIDEIRELFNYPPLPNGAGQHAPIRGEFYMVDEGKETDENGESEQNI